MGYGDKGYCGIKSWSEEAQKAWYSRDHNNRNVNPKVIRDDRPYYDITADRFMQLRYNMSTFNNKGSFVYLLHCVGTDIYKIGKSDNIKTRISELRGGCPYELELYAQTWLSTQKGAFAYESHLHNFFDKFRLNGEWFSLSQSLFEVLLDDFLDPYSQTLFFNGEVPIIARKDLTNEEKEEFRHSWICLSELPERASVESEGIQ